jgi:hypothetical protein
LDNQNPTTQDKQNCRSSVSVSVSDSLPKNKSPDGDSSPRGDPGEKRPACPQKEILALYHEILPELPKVREWSDFREKTLRSRWKSDPKYQNLAFWEGFFRSVRASPFLMGKVKDFKADLEWLIRPKNFVKVIEGRYFEPARGEEYREHPTLRKMREEEHGEGRNRPTLPDRGG